MDLERNQLENHFVNGNGVGMYSLINENAKKIDRFSKISLEIVLA